MPTPAKLFSLTITTRFEAEGTEWVAYSDGTFTDVVEAVEWDADIDPDDYGRGVDTDGEALHADYSVWCAATTTPSAEVYRAGLAAAGDTYWSTGAHGGVESWCGGTPPSSAAIDAALDEDEDEDDSATALADLLDEYRAWDVDGESRSAVIESSGAWWRVSRGPSGDAASRHATREAADAAE